MNAFMGMNCGPVVRGWCKNDADPIPPAASRAESPLPAPTGDNPIGIGREEEHLFKLEAAITLYDTIEHARWRSSYRLSSLNRAEVARSGQDR